ncbi:MAG: divalent metal cation transporter, partial [Leptolyngbya sp.]|nr:divalent metal cation transporter [Candidatus Melainabacteria bacterium]
IASVFKWLTLSLFAYVITAFFCHIDFNTVLKDTFIPNVTMQPTYIAALLAILGTTISPYLFFWQCNTEVDEQKDAGQKEVADRKGASDNDLKYAAYDVGAGMLFSNIVMYFIILTAAATLYKGGIHEIDSAAQAAKALEPMLGSAAKYLFAAGFIGTGFLAVPVLIGSAAYAITEALGHPCGYGEKFGDAKVYYGLVIASILVGMCINFMNINAMQALYWTAILNGVLAPPLLLLLMLVSNDKKIMGVRTNSLLVNIGGWLTFGIMTLTVVLYAWTSFVK